MGYYGNGWIGSGTQMLFGGGFWLLLIVLVIAAVFWFSRSPRSAAEREHGASGLEILDARYARGELDRDEYLQKKRDMLGQGPNSQSTRSHYTK